MKNGLFANEQYEHRRGQSMIDAISDCLDGVMPGVGRGADHVLGLVQGLWLC